MDINDMIEFQEGRILDARKALRKEVDDWKKLCAQRDKLLRDQEAKDYLNINKRLLG